jgi:hypothetical protein
MLNGSTYKRKKKSMQVEWPRSHRHSQACGRMTRTVGEDNRLLRVVDIRMPHPVGNGATAAAVALSETVCPKRGPVKGNLPDSSFHHDFLETT